MNKQLVSFQNYLEFCQLCRAESN